MALWRQEAVASCIGERAGLADWHPGESRLRPGARQCVCATRLKTGAPECVRTTLKQGAGERMWEPVLEAQRTETCQPWERGLGEWLWGAQPATM